MVRKSSFSEDTMACLTFTSTTFTVLILWRTSGILLQLGDRHLVREEGKAVLLSRRKCENWSKNLENPILTEFLFSGFYSVEHGESILHRNNWMISFWMSSPYFPVRRAHRKRHRATQVNHSSLITTILTSLTLSHLSGLFAFLLSSAIT